MKLWHVWAALWVAGVLALAAAAGLTIAAGYVVYRLAEILTYGG